jgi:hypothetical protein
MSKKFFTKSLFFLALTASVLVGCDNDEDSKNNSCQLISVAESSEDDSNTIAYTYENNKIVKAITTYTDGGQPEVYTSNITYNANGFITEINDDGEKTVFTYNSNNEIIKAEDFYGTATIDDRTEFEYASGRIIKVQFYSQTNTGTFVKGEYDVFEYASASSKNPVKIKSYSANGTLSSTSEFEYDDKKNPLTDYPAVMKISALYGEPVENNVTKKTWTSPGSTQTEITTNVYEYSSSGFPTKETETTVWGNDTYTETTIFTYNCN